MLKVQYDEGEGPTQLRAQALDAGGPRFKEIKKGSQESDELVSSDYQDLVGVKVASEVIVRAYA